MSKIYVFGIGGTGSRVIKALTMLLASGVAINTDSIVPIIIDPDDAAADLTRAVRQMREYTFIHKKLDLTTSNKNQFFSNPMEELVKNFRMSLEDTRDIRFRDYIAQSEMKNKDGSFNANYALTSMLFSEENLDSYMEVGFKGNPNVGSVVLNQFAKSQTFTEFASTFKQGDRIFIVSSIFGGTGASGFPLLLKNLRGIDASMPGYGLIKDAPIGAITLLPYFDVTQSEDSKINSSTFIAKSKAALSYYDRNISGNKSLNALYYLGDTLSSQYKNSEGGVSQKNNAHFIELLAALSIIDFAKLDSTRLECNDGEALYPIYKEFGMKEDSSCVTFPDLENATLDIIQAPMTRFVLFCKYMEENLDNSYKSQPYAVDHKLDSNFFKSGFYASSLKYIREAYIEWLKEMGNNQRGFEPFELEISKKELFDLVKGVPPRKVMSLKSNYDLYTDRLNSISKKTSRDGLAEQRFMEIFYCATKKIVQEKFGF